MDLETLNSQLQIFYLEAEWPDWLRNGKRHLNIPIHSLMSPRLTRAGFLCGTKTTSWKVWNPTQACLQDTLTERSKQQQNPTNQPQHHKGTQDSASPVLRFWVELVWWSPMYTPATPEPSSAESRLTAPLGQACPLTATIDSVTGGEALPHPAHTHFLTTKQMTSRCHGSSFGSTHKCSWTMINPKVAFRKTSKENIINHNNQF